MNFRLIDTGYNNAYMNMAIDEALLTSKTPVLRFYRWKPAGLSLGYFQDINDINVGFCKRNNISIVRRLTGGKTVLHDKELTYSFIISEKSMPKSIIDSYKIISKGILLALKELGINASMKEINVNKPIINKNLSTKNINEKSSIKKIKNNSAVCFNEPSYYEIIASNKKIVGSAQTRKQGKLLQHGAVLIDIDIERYVNCFNLKNIKDEIEKSKNRITSINSEINAERSEANRQPKIGVNNGRADRRNKIRFLANKDNLINDKKITYEQVAKAMENGFKENFKAKLIKDELNSKEIALADKLYKEKYQTKGWNFK